MLAPAIILIKRLFETPLDNVSVLSLLYRLKKVKQNLIIRILKSLRFTKNALEKRLKRYFNWKKDMELLMI